MKFATGYVTSERTETVLKLLEKVAETASDFRLAQRSRPFARINGGVKKLGEELDKALDAYHSELAESEDCRDIPV